MGIVGNMRLERAIACKISGDYETALTELQTVISEEPDNSEAHHQLGLVLGFTGEFDGSLDALRTAVSLDSSNLAARNSLAKTYAMLSMYDEAIAEFKEVMRLDINDELKAKEQLDFIEMMM